MTTTLLLLFCLQNQLRGLNPKALRFKDGLLQSLNSTSQVLVLAKRRDTESCGTIIDIVDSESSCRGPEGLIGREVIRSLKSAEFETHLEFVLHLSSETET